VDAEEFWDAWYRGGTPSGEGSVGVLAAFKWSIVDEIAGRLESVIDVGCGDLSFWGDRDVRSYIGIDVSGVVLARNKESRPGWQFLRADASELQPGISAPVVFCFDVLFHILDDATYSSILRNLTEYSDDLIFIRTWDWNPLNSWRFRKNLLRSRRLGLFFKSLFRRLETDHVYQAYRDFTRDTQFFEDRGFELVARRKAPERRDGAVFVFRRRSLRTERPPPRPRPEP
jgi:hypothetical protein